MTDKGYGTLVLSGTAQEGRQWLRDNEHPAPGRWVASLGDVEGARAYLFVILPGADLDFTRELRRAFHHMNHAEWREVH